MSKNKPLTGYPSIDKPWLKYYSEEAINAPLPECTMYEYIWENNRDHLSDIALRYYGTKVTYGKLFENIKKAAAAFHAMSIRAGDIVTIMSMHTPETIYAIYGLNYIGAVANMVYLTLTEKEILDTLENTESKLLLALDVAQEKVEAIKGKISIPVIVLGVADSMPTYIKLGYKLKVKSKKHSVLTWRDFLAQGAHEPSMSTDHATPAVIVYTSGTTGEPKGVVLSNDSLNSLAFEYKCSTVGLQRNETFLNILPPFIGFGISIMHVSVIHGLETTLWIDLKSNNIAKAINKNKPQLFLGAPVFLEPIMKYLSGNLSYLKYFAGGGASPTREQEDQINSFLKMRGSTAKYVTGYGMTEFSATVCTCTNIAYKPSSVGIPLPRVNIKIVDFDTGNFLPIGEVGEMWFSTPSLMCGYFKNEDATNHVFSKDEYGITWLRTGDLGYVDDDGFVFIQGRMKRIYPVRGKDNVIYRLFPQRIEELYEAKSNIRLCGVIVEPDPIQINVPRAFVELKPDEMITKEQAIMALTEVSQKELPEHMQPESIHVLDSMPLTPSGKVDYRALEEMAKEDTHHA